METGYLKRSWDALRADPGWWKTIAVLSIIQFIPVAGSIVVYGYLYRWARDAAWGIEKPLPNGIGDLNPVLRSGLISFVIALCWGLVISLVYTILSEVPLIGVLFALVGVVGSFVASMLMQVAMLRAVIYDSFEPGVQIKQAWEMSKREPMGLLKILGMMMLASLIIVFFALIIGGIVALIAVLYVPAVESGVNAEALLSVSLTLLPFIIVFCVVFLLVMMLFTTVVNALVARAMGYWMAQFEPAKWGASKDFLPIGVGPVPSVPE
ncbi:MAG: DUF4013 domain-containing protein [Actinobacteria bacterium]|nr:DUF4013 domain-containing protein [Actinomycetota bacterium]